MLIVHRLSAEGYRYYVGAVGPPAGPEPALGEAPGKWVGHGAAAVGLAGEVSAADLRRVLPRGSGRVPGFDLTFAAPKSVSVLHGLGAPAVVDAVREAHDAAVIAGLAYIERHAAGVRVAGRVCEADGVVVAAFRHRVSRADDPHLHTHALVANVAPYGGTGRALHSPLLYGAQRGAGAVYQAVLRHRLATDLGVTWTAVAGGRADIVEVPPTVRRLFSQRRAAVLAEAGSGMDERGWAERFTRPERDDLVDMAGLRRAWVVRAAWTPPVPGPPRHLAGSEIDAISTVPGDDRWTRSTLMVAIGDHLPDGAPADRLEVLADEVIGSSGVRRLGRSPGRHADERFTSDRSLQRQARVALQVSAGVVSDRPADLDRLRQERTPGRVLVVVGDDTAAAVISDRAGVYAAAAADARRALDHFGLRSGDLLVVTRPERRDSRLLEPVLGLARDRGVDVVSGRPHPRPPAVTLEPGPVVTADLGDGSISIAGTAGAAARQAISDWAAARAAGHEAVLVAERSEVASIAPAARAALREAGLVGEGSWAPGDVIVFPTARPSAGVARYDRAAIEQIGARTARLRMEDGRRMEVGASWLSGVWQGHVVPPAPQLITGRGAVYVVGGRGFNDRHLAGNPIHNYVTVDIGGSRADLLPGGRRASLTTLDRWLAAADASPDFGDQRRARQQRRAANEWMAHARTELHRAQVRGDVSAARVWDTQRSAAERQLDSVAAPAAPGDRLARRDVLTVYRALRAEAVLRVAERNERTPGDSVTRQVGRAAARGALLTRRDRPRQIETELFVGR